MTRNTVPATMNARANRSQARAFSRLSGSALRSIRSFSGRRSSDSGATNEGPQAGPFVVAFLKLQQDAEEQEAALVRLSFDRCRSSGTRVRQVVYHTADSKTGVDQRARRVCRGIRRDIDVHAD